MNREFGIPPINKSLLTPPEVLVGYLSVLIGKKFKLTRKTRTDGSNARKLIAETLEQHALPPLAHPGSYVVMPQKGKGVPRILREYIDTYIVTTGDSYNLQVWNRNPASNSVQIEYSSEEKLLAKDVRFVFLRVNPDTQEIRSVLILTPKYIEAKFGKFGKPTIKHQMLITPRTRELILRNNPPIIFYPDTPRVAEIVSNKGIVVFGSIHDEPIPRAIISLEVLKGRFVNEIVGAKLDDAATKNRGQALELLVSHLLGYAPNEKELLAGGYPDIRNQALEVKVQDSPTVDLGMFSPEFEENVPACPEMTTLDIRYLIALTKKHTGAVEGLILCPGSKLGEHFSYVSDISFKCQRSIPMRFFDQFDGRAVFNP